MQKTLNPRKLIPGSPKPRAACRWVLTAALLQILLWCAPGQAAESTAEIRSWDQLQKLSKTDALEGLPIRVKAAVLCYDGGWNQLYLHDGQSTRYLDPKLFTSAPPVGEFVEVTGQTSFADSGATLTNAQFKLARRGAWPAATKLSTRQLAQGPGRWVETSGRVRVIDTSWGRLALQLRDDDQDCVVFVMGPVTTNDCSWLLDCRIRVTGINGQHKGTPSVIVPSLHELKVIERASAKLSEVPVSPIGTLQSRELGAWTNNRVCVNGLVASYQPGESLLVKDPTGRIQARVLQTTVAPIDSWVKVWGFFRVSSNQVSLQDAFFEAASANDPALRAPATGRGPELSDSRPVQPLTNIVDVFRLDRTEAARGLPVQLEGVMTYADASWKNGFVQDATGGIYVYVEQPEIRAGQRVRVSGLTGPGGFAPEIVGAKFTILGETNLPEPVKVELSDLASGGLDSRWIGMEGIVRRVTEENEHFHFSVATRQGPIKLLVPNYQHLPLPEHLIDSSVFVQGACGSHMTSRGQLSGVTLHVPTLDLIQVEEAAPVDPFQGATIPLGNVATFDRDRLTGRRVKVSGVVTLLIPPGGAYIQDASGALRVQADRMDGIKPGDQVEVLGFPTVGDFSPQLTEAKIKRIGPGKPPTPRNVTAEGILFYPTNDAMVVSIQARLLQNVPRSANPQLLLQEGPIIFSARLEGAGSMDQQFESLRAGSLLSLTGVCAIQGGESHEPKGFRLLLREPRDLVVLKTPPWWTPRHTLSLIGSLILVIGAAVAWIALLHRQVRAQTEVIRQKLDERKAFADSLARERNLLATLIDHLPDSVFVKDLDRRYVLTNLAHSRFHGAASSDDVVGKTSAGLMDDTAAKAAADSDREVLEKAVPVVDQELSMTDANGNARDLLMTKVPLRDGSGQLIGLVGIARDVTERRRSEAKLRRAQSELLQASRLAGMAEVATSVLHNVGNVLNSINVSANLLLGIVKNSKVASITKIASLLEEHSNDLATFFASDAKGQQVAPYLKRLGEYLQTEQTALLRETELVRKHVEHINKIVAMQQDYARVSGVAERVALVELVEDALRLNEAGLQRDGVQVVREYTVPGPEISTDRHKVLQILVNLIRNARHACVESGHDPKKLTASITHDQRCVRIQIKDNGVGIPPENLTRIFNHGFTTRKHGHGFGLHSGALAARELGGSLSGTSDGVGQGATFTLELPQATPPSPHASSSV